MARNSRYLQHYKLPSEFAEGCVTHRRIQSDLSTRIEVVSTWVHSRQLGAGAFGEVSLQREHSSGQLRAVKVIAKTQLRPDEMESLICVQDHRDLFVAFLGWYEDPCSVHIAMEYIAYGDLGQYISYYPDDARSKAKEIASQILKGLVVLHQREICHRDLKPQNVLMASLSPLWLKISDFGIAKRWGGTELRTHCGTVIYQAPELLGLLPKQMRQTGQSYSPSIDIWALGAVVHQVLTSEVPFTESSPSLTGFTSMTDSGWASIDAELLLNYCAGREPFPNATMTKQGASRDTIRFVTSLMVPDPKGRPTALDAFQSSWLASTRPNALCTVDNSNQFLAGFINLDVDVNANNELGASPIPLASLDRFRQPALHTPLATLKAVPSNGRVNMILLMGESDASKSHFASIFNDNPIHADRCPRLLTSSFNVTSIIRVDNNWVRLIIGPTSELSQINYCLGLQELLDRCAQGHKVNGIIHLHSPTRESIRHNHLAAGNQIKSISTLCAPCFSEGMMIGIHVRKGPNYDGIFEDEKLGITEATPPRSALKIQCMAVVREILRQESIAVASSPYLYDLATDIATDLFMNFDGLQ